MSTDDTTEPQAAPAAVGPRLDGGVGRLAPERVDILRHALGLGRGSREYRNHFVTGPGSTDYPHCEALVAAGLMTRSEGHALSGGDPVFRVTEAGRVAAGLRPRTVMRHETPNAGIQARP